MSLVSCDNGDKIYKVRVMNGETVYKDSSTADHTYLGFTAEVAPASMEKNIIMEHDDSLNSTDVEYL